MSARYADILAQMQRAILVSEAGAESLLIDRDDFPVKSQINIYRHGYHVRMFKVVCDDFPALSHYAKDTQMKTWIQAYIAATPSQHYNLDTYSLAFPTFLKTQTQDSFAQDLATLEGAIKEVYMMEESEALDPMSLGSDMDKILLAPRAASRLLACEYPVNAYLSDFRLHGTATPPAPQKTFCFVYRHRHNVKRADFSAEEYTLMQALSSRAPLAKALETMTHLEDTTVQTAFARFVSEGMLTRL